jgi:DNA-binding GntR family transcriptional regulator
MDTGRTTAPNTGWYTESHTDVPVDAFSSIRPDGGGAPTTAVGLAYEAIKRSLLVGEYVLGLRLAEERLAKEVGVSRTPVREALLRLHTEGLVNRHPSGGYSPTVPNIAEVRELYEVRMALERAGLLRPRLTGTPHDRDALEALRDDWAAMAEDPAAPTPEFVVWDESFHLRLAEASGNRELADLLRRVNERIRIVRMRDFLTTDRISRTISEHLELVELLLAGDLDGALTQYDDHVQTSFDVVEQRVAGALLQMAAQR